MDTKYKIVFTSLEIPEYARDRVKANLSVVFKTSVANLEPLFSDRPVTIKKDLSLLEATRYRDTIEREGGRCRIEPINESTDSMSMQIAVDQPPLVRCPKCRKQQARTDVCRACGMILSDYGREIAEAKQASIWVEGRDPERRRNADRRLKRDRREALRLQNDRRNGEERRTSIAGWHGNWDAARHS